MYSLCIVVRELFWAKLFRGEDEILCISFSHFFTIQRQRATFHESYFYFSTQNEAYSNLPFFSMSLLRPRIKRSCPKVGIVQGFIFFMDLIETMRICPVLFPMRAQEIVIFKHVCSRIQAQILDERWGWSDSLHVILLCHMGVL